MHVLAGKEGSYHTHLWSGILNSVALSIVLLHLVKKLIVVDLGHPWVSHKDDPVCLVQSNIDIQILQFLTRT